MSSKERKFLKEEFYGWRCEEKTLERYLEICKLSCKNDEYFNTFKRNGSYTPILEHVTVGESQKYLDLIINENVDLALQIKNVFSINDRLGNPKTFKHSISEVTNTLFEFEASPTTIRYVKVLSDLINLFGDLNDLIIVEIGGGYGGLAAVIHQRFKFKHYYNVDLEWPGNLAKKYTSKLDIDNFTSVTPDKIKNFNKIDLVISNYAFSECNLETRTEYIDKILSKSRMGYLTHNGDDDRRNSTKQVIKEYKNFDVFGHDGKKNHPIFVWNKKEG